MAEIQKLDTTDSDTDSAITKAVLVEMYKRAWANLDIHVEGRENALTNAIQSVAVIATVFTLVSHFIGDQGAYIVIFLPLAVGVQISKWKVHTLKIREAQGYLVDFELKLKETGSFELLETYNKKQPKTKTSLRFGLIFGILLVLSTIVVGIAMNAVTNGLYAGSFAIGTLLLGLAFFWI